MQKKWKQLLACLAAPLAPYLLWVSFTAYLNAGIWLLN